MPLRILWWWAKSWEATQGAWGSYRNSSLENIFTDIFANCSPYLFFSVQSDFSHFLLQQTPYWNPFFSKAHIKTVVQRQQQAESDAGHARGTAKALWNIPHGQASSRTLVSLEWQSYLLGWDRHSSSPLSASCIHKERRKTLISFSICRKQRLAFHWFDCERQGELSLLLHAAVSREELTFCSAVTSCSLRSLLKTQHYRNICPCRILHDSARTPSDPCQTQQAKSQTHSSLLGKNLWVFITFMESILIHSPVSAIKCKKIHKTSM